MAPKIVVLRRSYLFLIVLLAILLGCTLIYAACSSWLALHWAEQGNPKDWAMAKRLQPNDARVWWRIAIHYERDPLHRNLPKAEECLLHAVHLNPSGYSYWAELGKVQEELGKHQNARRAYERAEAAAPFSALVAWEYGSFLLRRGDTYLAAQYVRRALTDKPNLTASAVEEFWKSGVPISTIANQVLPPIRGNYLNAISYFLSQEQHDDALACWNKLESHHLEIKLKQTLPLIDDLIAQDRIVDAHLVWLEALRASGSSERTGANGSLLFNGEFEHGLINGGFGWRQTPAPGTAFDLVTDITHGSSRSARVVFDGSKNVDYANLFQYVPVEPNHRYRFSAFVRTDRISTDSGPKFLITGCANPFPKIAETTAMTGTNPWTTVEAEFKTGAQTNCVKVVLRRPRSQFLSNEIMGAVWVDGVRMQQLTSRQIVHPHSEQSRPTLPEKR